RALGEGGMGAVFLASHLALGDRQVAIKRISVSTATPAEVRLEQLRREAELLSSLHHPNLVTVHDFFVEGQNPYLVMEYVEGMTLDEAVRIHGNSPAIVTRWLVEIARVLEYLHGREVPVLFRDLKPSNVMLDKHQNMKLIDFGIARLATPATRTATLMQGLGTPGFSPPEQYRGSTDSRSDVYSLGATGYALLTGVVPPDSVSLLAGEEVLEPPSRFNPGVTPALEDAITWMLSPRREERPQSAREARVALEVACQEVPASDAVTVAGRCLDCGGLLRTPASACIDCHPSALPATVPRPNPSARPRPVVRLGALLAIGMTAVFILFVGWAGILVLKSRGVGRAQAEGERLREARAAQKASWAEESARTEREETQRRQARAERAKEDAAINARIARSGEEARKAREELARLRVVEAEKNRLLVEAQRERLAAQAELRALQEQVAATQTAASEAERERIQMQLARVAEANRYEAAARMSRDAQARAAQERQAAQERYQQQQIELQRQALRQAEASRDAAAAREANLRRQRESDAFRNRPLPEFQWNRHLGK
ncbi:MAG: hypothetical protein FJX76_26870, partial [Armatimonadetes bacterium]|nr:hypothetical protein [Armatimonadota bacterium]